VIVKAFAGTGKTFTKIVGVGWAFGHEFWPEIEAGIAKMAGVPVEGFHVTPSAEQQLVWDQLKISAAAGVKSVTYCAFNKSIVTEFGEKWGWLVRLLKDKAKIDLQFATVNSLGYRSVRAAYGWIKPNRNHIEILIGTHLNRDPRQLEREDQTFFRATVALVRMCKLTLTGWTKEHGFDASSITRDELDQLCSHYDIELNGCQDRVYNLVPKILEANRRMDVRGLDFDDQNWLPVVNRLPIERFDLLLVDEAQDLPRVKQEYAILAGERLFVVGDSFQAIYGFAGADVDSIPRMEKLLSEVTAATVLKLTETRRCAKLIVKEAQAIVPDFKAHESNPEGSVIHTTMKEYVTLVQEGDMCLCRVNAPLVSEALRFIKDGRKATIRGRKFGDELVNFVTKKLKAKDPVDLVEKADRWLEMESAKEEKKRFPDEGRLMNLQDKYDCIVAFTEGAETIDQVVSKMQLVFGGKECPTCHRRFDEEVERCFNCKTERDAGGYACGPKLVTPKGILFSSVHRAKGLESKRVFILQPKGATMPHPMAKSDWQRGQEQNLIYVARTRAISELVYVTAGGETVSPAVVQATKDVQRRRGATK
jgi:superfamily I DNA/RNA helicase